MVVILLCELLILIFLRQKIASLTTHLFSLWGGSRGQAIWFYAILTLPGVLVHEIAHFLTAAFLGLRTGKIEMLPNLHADGGVELGSVQVEKGDPLRHSIVGLAPLLVGPLFVVWLSTLIKLNNLLTPTQLAIAYFIATISLHMFPSKQDMRSWPVVAVLLLVLGSLLWTLGVTLPSLQPLHRGFEKVLDLAIVGVGTGVAFSLGMLLILAVVQLGSLLWKKNHSSH